MIGLFILKENDHKSYFYLRAGHAPNNHNLLFFSTKKLKKNLLNTENKARVESKFLGGAKKKKIVKATNTEGRERERKKERKKGEEIKKQNKPRQDKRSIHFFTALMRPENKKKKIKKSKQVKCQPQLPYGNDNWYYK